MGTARRSAARAGAVLTVDLDAIRANYRLLRDTRRRGAACAGVMKADAYGLGMEQVAPALAREGCRVFFTAHLDEGIAPARPGAGRTAPSTCCMARCRAPPATSSSTT